MSHIYPYQSYKMHAWINNSLNRRRMYGQLTWNEEMLAKLLEEKKGPLRTVTFPITMEVDWLLASPTWIYTDMAEYSRKFKKYKCHHHTSAQMSMFLSLMVTPELSGDLIHQYRNSPKPECIEPTLQEITHTFIKISNEWGIYGEIISHCKIYFDSFANLLPWILVPRDRSIWCLNHCLSCSC